MSGGIKARNTELTLMSAVSFGFAFSPGGVAAVVPSFSG